MKKNHQRISLRILLSLSFISTCMMPVVLAEDRDIGLRVRSDGANVSIAACSDQCSGSSPLKIYKGKIYSIKLVDPADSSATKLRVQTNTGVKALKKYTPITGNFRSENSCGKQWLTTITCRCASDGSNHTLNFNAPGDGCCFDGGCPYSYGSNGNPFILRCKIREAIHNKGLSVTYPNNDGTFGRTNGSGAEDVNSLTAICKIMGYDSYVSSTSPSNAYDGRSNYFSCGDNYLYYFSGSY